jgi:hypothetical protein
MTQTLPATAILGPGKTGLTIGYRILDIDRVEYSAFTATGVVETLTAGTYSVAGGVVAPRAGGYIIWGEALVDLAEDEIRPAFGWTGSATGSGAYYDDLLDDMPQINRDAMLLAPTAGATAVDSVDAMLTGILAAIGGELVEGAYTRDDVLRIMAAALAGVTAGSGTDTVTFRGLDGTTTRIAATVSNEGNRTQMVLDGEA